MNAADRTSLIRAEIAKRERYVMHVLALIAGTPDRGEVFRLLGIAADLTDEAAILDERARMATAFANFADGELPRLREVRANG